MRGRLPPRGLVMWVPSDNLRRGAATNAVQIAESLVHNGWLQGDPYAVCARHLVRTALLGG